MRSIRRSVSIFSSIAVLSAIIVPPSSAGAAPPGGSRMEVPRSTSSTVTLVTGDKVTLRTPASGKPTVSVDPAGPAKVGTSFSTVRRNGDVFVIPGDVAELVPRVLDDGLFNVTKLVAMGYDDAATDVVPLIVRGPRAFATSFDHVRDLPSIGASAVELSKPKAGAFGEALADRSETANARRSGDGTKIWLDAKVQVSEWDANLKTIGAPQAWASGLSGAGVDVAVLDTGVDATHPDLAGQLVASKNFSTSPSTDDKNGHGTHVASIVAGTGAAADGARRGVAFGADLISGKVLDDDGGGRASWVIDGMRWATEQGADVINLSLGAPAGDTDDPMAIAVDSLTASTGALFVIAAGNHGPYTSSINSPGIAERALTVAAGASGGAAQFSSRGPTRGTQRLKPDISAPGIEIVGARAGGGDMYVTMSGTSQATPHVAGAAALLVEKYPHWSQQQLKAALTTTAHRSGDGRAYEEGAGLLDVEQAADETLRVSRSNLDFGFLRYPEGRDPTSIDVTLTNTDTQAQSVTLTDAERHLRGGQAPVDMVTVTPSRLRLPPGGQVTVTVTLRPDRGEPGVYNGHLNLARDEGASLTLPIAILAEPPRYDLDLTVLDRNGEPYSGGYVTLANMHDMWPRNGGGFQRVYMDENGQATARMMPGAISAVAKIVTPASNGEPATVTLAGSPEVMLTKDTSLTIDARAGKRLPPATVAGAPTEVVSSQIHYARWHDATHHIGGMGEVITATPKQIENGQVFLQPTEPVEFGTVGFETGWQLATTGNRRGHQAEVYHLLLGGPTVPNPPTYTVSRKEKSKLARVHADYRALGGPAVHTDSMTGQTEVMGLAFKPKVRLPVPQQRIEWLNVRPGLRWQQCVVGAAILCGPPKSFTAGERATEVWNRAPTPVSHDAWHYPDTLGVEIGLTDGAHHGPLVDLWALGEQTLRLFRDGKELPRRSETFFETSPDPGMYRLEHTARPNQESLPIGTEVRTTWKFPSRGGSSQNEFTTPRLLAMDYRPHTGPYGTLPGWWPLMMKVKLTIPGDDSYPVAADDSSLRFWASTDQGGHWRKALVIPMQDSTFFVLVPGMLPRPGDSISIRARGTAAEGRTIDQTIIDAYPVRKM